MSSHNINAITTCTPKPLSIKTFSRSINVISARQVASTPPSPHRWCILTMLCDTQITGKLGSHEYGQRKRVTDLLVKHIPHWCGTDTTRVHSCNSAKTTKRTQISSLSSHLYLYCDGSYLSALIGNGRSLHIYPLYILLEFRSNYYPTWKHIPQL